MLSCKLGIFVTNGILYWQNCQQFSWSKPVPISCSDIGRSKLLSGSASCDQWRNQSAAVARAQHGHTTFASSLVPRPRPAFSGLQYGNGEATRGVWGMLPQKILSFLGRFWGYVRPYCCLELEHFDNAFATNLRARSVRSLWYLRQTHIHRDQGSLRISLFWRYR